MKNKSLSKQRIFIVLTFVIIIIISGYYIFTKYSNNKTIIDFPEIKASGKLKIVTDYNILNYYVSGDTIAGFTHDLLSLLAKDLGVEVDIMVENNLDKCIKGLENGNYDIIARNIPINNALKDSISFTHPIIRNKLVLIQRKPENGSNNRLIRNHLDLANIVVYVPRSSPAKLRLENLSLEIGDTIFIKEDSLYDASQLIIKVAAGEIDYAVCDASIAKRLLANNPEIDIKTDIGFTHLEAWAVRKDSPILLDSLNLWIDRTQSSPEFDKIHKQYFGRK